MSLISQAAAFDNTTILDALGLKPGDLSIGVAAAKAMLRRGEGPQALRMFAMLALCEPMDIHIQLGLAECAAELEQHELVIQAAAALIAMAPHDARGYFLSGRACLMAGYEAEAQEDLTTAARLDREQGGGFIATEAERLLAVRAASSAA
jgi:Flp pilus assembly protein TadD